MGKPRIGRYARIATAAIVAVAWLPAGTVMAGGNGHGPQPPKQPHVSVIATGLYNPRGVSVGWDGSVYVAESGAGGDTIADGEVAGTPSKVCVGDTGGVTRVRHGDQKRIVTLASMTGAVDNECDPAKIGESSVGPSDIASNLDGSLSISMGLGGNVDTRAQLPDDAAASFGHLLSIDRRGRLSNVADLTAYEHTANPEPTQDDSNPYGVASALGFNFVADAGGNDVLTVDRRGQVSTLAVIPAPAAPVPTPQVACAPNGDNTLLHLPPAGTPVPAQAVATSVAIGAGGIYVAQLTGFPFGTGVASVFNVNPFTHKVTTVASGLTAVVGLAAGPDGSLYTLEMSSTSVLNVEICGIADGQIVKIKNGQQTTINLPAGTLDAPGGIAVGADGTIYVSNNSIAPGGAGTLLAIRQH